MSRLTVALGAGLLILLAACATRQGPGAPVPAVFETVGRGGARVHDIALWTGRETTFAGVRASQLMIVSSSAGLDVLDDDGTRLQHIPARHFGDIDVASLPTEESHFTVLGASSRPPGERGMALFRFENVIGGEFTRWGTVRTDIARPTGFCMRQWRGQVTAVVTGGAGEVRVFAVSEGPGGQVAAREQGRFRLRSRVSGCAIDAVAGHLYLSEAGQGLWRYPLDPASSAAPLLVQAVDRVRLRAPVEGVALLDDFGRYLLVSSRGDSSIAVWKLSSEPQWLGRFIAPAGRVDGVTGTTGLDAYGGMFGDFLQGVVVLQDSANDGGQNFKLVDWQEVRVALGLDGSPRAAPNPPGPANTPPTAPSGSD